MLFRCSRLFLRRLVCRFCPRRLTRRRFIRHIYQPVASVNLNEWPDVSEKWKSEALVLLVWLVICIVFIVTTITTIIITRVIIIIIIIVISFIIIVSRGCCPLVKHDGRGLERRGGPPRLLDGLVIWYAVIQYTRILILYCNILEYTRIYCTMIYYTIMWYNHVSSSPGPWMSCKTGTPLHARCTVCSPHSSKLDVSKRGCQIPGCWLPST